MSLMYRVHFYRDTPPGMTTHIHIASHIRANIENIAYIANIAYKRP